jgi:hypothetical protein
MLSQKEKKKNRTSNLDSLIIHSLSNEYTWELSMTLGTYMFLLQTYFIIIFSIDLI